MGGFDVHATPTLELNAWNMFAEFWVEPAGELAASDGALHLATDQVRFVRDGESLPLTEVSATVFSEVIRDVDLFIGVGSIRSDPDRQDQGEIEDAGDYWRGHSFDELNATAKTRTEVLERLMPKLKIAGQCAFEDKFLVVRGRLRRYKIHLGSGNIQMEPNNQINLFHRRIILTTPSMRCFRVPYTTNTSLHRRELESGGCRLTDCSNPGCQRFAQEFAGAVKPGLHGLGRRIESLGGIVERKFLPLAQDNGLAHIGR